MDTPDPAYCLLPTACCLLPIASTSFFFTRFLISGRLTPASLKPMIRPFASGLRRANEDVALKSTVGKSGPTKDTIRQALSPQYGFG